jgi:hypothetical protein
MGFLFSIRERERHRKLGCDFSRIVDFDPAEEKDSNSRFPITYWASSGPISLPSGLHRNLEVL